MKKLLSIFISLAFIISVTPYANASSAADELVEIIANSVESSEVQMEAESTILYGDENKITIKESMEDDDNNKLKMEGTVIASINTNELPKIVQEELDTFNLTFDGKVSFDLFMNKKTNEVYFGYSDY